MKHLKLFIAFFHSQGLRTIIYLNDIRFFHSDPYALRTQTVWVIHWLQNLGFIINFPKSSIFPSQTIQFLRFKVDLLQAVLRLPASKILNIKKEFRKAVRADLIFLRTLARLGLLFASIQVIFRGPLHYRVTQRLKAYYLRSHEHNPEVRSELHWGLHHLEV